MIAMEQGEFDLSGGREDRDKGMESAAGGAAEILELAREIALDIGSRRDLSIDDVQAELIARGFTPADLGKAAGSVFKGDMWTPIGFTQTSRKSSHARHVRLWRLVSRRFYTGLGAEVLDYLAKNGPAGAAGIARALKTRLDSVREVLLDLLSGEQVIRTVIDTPKGRRGGWRIAR